MNPKKIIILILALAILIVGILVIARSVSNKELKNGIPSQSKDSANPTEDSQVVPDAKSILQGKITQVDMTTLTVTDANKNEIKLNIPEKDVKFYAETKLGEGITLKEIGLFDLKVDSDVEIEYNPETSNLNFIKVLVK
jgi:Flp pilus assembly protein CpaB